LWQNGERIKKLIHKKLNAIKTKRHKLVILVGPFSSGKTKLVKNLEQENPERYKYLNLNLELSNLLKDSTIDQRRFVTRKYIANLCSRVKKEMLIDNIEVLFDPDLEINPVKSLETLSINNIVIASWCGRIEDKFLIYAKPDHREYRRCPVNDNVVIDMEKVSEWN
jgi:predicted AAA+ superfamily ATPase